VIKFLSPNHHHYHHHNNNNNNNNNSIISRMSTPPTPPPPDDYDPEEAAYFKTISDTTLAAAVFKNRAVSGGVKVEEKSLHSEEWNLALLEVMKIFKVYSLEAADPFTTFWHATIVEKSVDFDFSQSKVPQVKKEIGRRVPFCCQRCKLNNTWFLLGIGKLAVDEDNIGCIEISRLFYHNKDCQVVMHPVAEFSVVNFDFLEVMGDTYDGVVQRMQNISFHDKTVEPPPGHSIDFGYAEYNFDDRCYEYLPSDMYPQIDKESHRLAMVRFFYLLTAYLNMADQTAFTLFDVEEVKANLARHNNSPPQGMIPLSIPLIPNPSVHLAFYEISLLFGGHCMLSDPDLTPVHQICHKDGETKDNLVRDNPRLVGKHKPGSFIIPLIDPRSIYVCTPMLQAEAEWGQFIVFHGALPHGGMTYKASMAGNDWKPAIHGHLDSKFHDRVQGYFDFESSDDVYFPLSHSRFMADQFPILDKGGDILWAALEEIMQRNRPVCKLTDLEAVKYNQFLVGQYSDKLELLNPSTTPMGPENILVQMKDTYKRLDQLIKLGNSCDKRLVSGKGCTQRNRDRRELIALLEKMKNRLGGNKK
jgi:hypothetical protein